MKKLSELQLSPRHAQAYSCKGTSAKYVVHTCTVYMHVRMPTKSNVSGRFEDVIGRILNMVQSLQLHGLVLVGASCDDLLALASVFDGYFSFDDNCSSKLDFTFNHQLGAVL